MTNVIAERNRQVGILEGTKFVRGMTENSNEKLHLPQFYPQVSRHLTSPNSIYSDACTGICTNANGQLTESNLQYNVQIVLNNLKRTAVAAAATTTTPTKPTYSISKQYNNNYGSNMSSPESDLNSNPQIGQQPPSHALGCSIASSHDFTHDNSDYQWFLDYGYRESGVIHQSVLSSLSASYNGIGELSYYDDMAKNIDANLAEVDMESFRAEDINLLLSKIPSFCKTKSKNKEMDNSICKSKQLFSPVKESILSVDSLDMDCYAEDCDMILTCQANKNNYTIAFEGSAILSEDSFYVGPKDLHRKIQMTNDISADMVAGKVQKFLDNSMARSETGLTTWSKLKKNSTSQLHRYPSGNNNHCVSLRGRHCSLVRKSNSLPNLQADGTTDTHIISNSTIDSYGKNQALLPMCLMPVSTSESDSPPPLQSSASSSGPHINQPSFNLVKLFIKQKSSSTDTCMDVSSGCWPSDSSSSGEQKHRKKNTMFDSGKGSALSKHDEDNEAEIHYDSLDIAATKDDDSAPTNGPSKSNDLYREVFDSPSHRKYKECTLNIQSIAKRNVNNNNSMEKDSLKETIKSLSDTSRTSDNITQVYAKTNLPLDLVTRSIQTSMMKESVKIVPPSFLAQLNNNSKATEKKQAPVYVVYPNYALPDLGFVKTYQSQIILSPLGLKESFPKKRRPLSTADMDSIRKKEYKHISDWKSLAPLLPNEYKKLLQHIPEVYNVVRDPKFSQKPMFSMSPPIRRNRPTSCDCSNYTINSSSGSASSQPPSSGFRGSSTMLTDSEFEAAVNNNNLLRNLNRMPYENSRLDEDSSSAELPPSGYTRRGILRRTHSSKSKRNSLNEDVVSDYSKLEKRCSVQDPYYATGNRISPTSNAQYYAEQHEELRRLYGQTKENFNIEQKESDTDARNRVEHFLSHVPKSELKYYAEIANILESLDNISDEYDRNKLRNDVSRALAYKRVSFHNDSTHSPLDNNNVKNRVGKEFTTPPNSPNISIAAGRGNNIDEIKQAENKSKQDKIQSNRFKRLQIQWELMSKEGPQMEKEFNQTRSGGSTPTSATPRSRIPRPVSYPAAKIHPSPVSKQQPSPSRLVTPKKYNIAPSTTPVSRPRTPSKPHNTPKKVPSASKVGNRAIQPSY